jgi:acyl dehydratase
MAINYKTLKNWEFDEFVHEYNHRDTILYALGLGFGTEPTDLGQLRYLLEDRLVAFPTMAVVIGLKAGWLAMPGTGVDYMKVLHGEQCLRIHRQIPSAGGVLSRTRVKEVVDKGKSKGAVVYTERHLYSRPDHELLATVTTASFCRADGGFGGPITKGPDPHPIPAGAPQHTIDLTTSRRAALIYRLSGDWNAIHGDPAAAKEAGFPVPILHGLCTYGVAGRAIVQQYCAGDGSRLTTLDVRFTAPVFPGETLRTECWRDGSIISFRSRALERDVIVLNHGRAEIL